MEFKQVKCFGFSKITNAYHAALFNTFRAFINKHGAERLNLPDEIVDVVSDLLDAEQIVVIVQILFLFSFKNRGRRNVRK